MDSVAIKLLKKHSLRKTSFRLRVLEVFMNAQEQAVSHSQLEQSLKTFDRITLYRTLKTFEKQGIIHQAIDGSNESKFALCHSDCSVHEHHDNHAHFLCDTCGTTFCLDNVVQSNFTLPNNYRLEKVQIALGGICGNCN